MELQFDYRLEYPATQPPIEDEEFTGLIPRTWLVHDEYRCIVAAASDSDFSRREVPVQDEVAGSRQSREPSLTVGLLNGSEVQLSSPRVSKGSALTGPWMRPSRRFF